MIAVVALVITGGLGAVAAALYGLARLADTSLFCWPDDDE